MGRFLAIALALATFGACKDNSKTAGLPPAPDWSANAGQLAPAQPGAAARANPHGGMGGNNPHAGVPGAPPLDDDTASGSSLPAGHPPVDDIHGGMGGNPDMAAMAPDPSGMRSAS